MASERVRPSQRFQRLLDQLSQCHEEELNRTVPTWLSADVDRVRHELTCPKCSFNLNVALPNSVNEDGKWGTRVRTPVHSGTICSGSGIRVEEITSPPPVPRPTNLLRVADAMPLKLRGDLDATPRSSESDVSVLEDDQDLAAQRITNAVSGLSNVTSHRSRSQGADERFPLRRLWALESKVTTMRVTRRAASKSKSIELDDTLSGSAQAKQESDGYMPEAMADWRRRLISYPSSLHRLVWDMMGGLLIMYDLFAVPLQAFDPPESPAGLAMDWITLVYWTMNVGASLTTGYVEEGITVMDPSLIVLRYLRTWFIVDLVVLGPDWVFTIIASDSGNEVRMLRVVRLARVIRLLRLVRLKRLFEKIEDALDSEYYSVLFNIFKMMLLLFTVNHVIACAWYALADLQPGGVNTWVDTLRLTMSLESFDWVHLYLVSLHWSLTQFTPAGMDVTPTNEIERGFTIGVVIFALVGFAYVVGSITASLGQLRAMSEEASKDFWQMRRFLNQNSVDHILAARIQRFVEYAYTRQQKTMSINQVKVLSLLSKQLMEELQSTINQPHMKVHPLFNFLNEFSFITMNRLAKESVSHMEMAQGDTLFLPEQHATCMYFVAFGRLEYVRVLESGEIKEFVDKGEDWLAEPSLWTENWYHVGEAKAYTDCEVLLIDPQAFENILNVVRPVASIVAQYCRLFMVWLESLEEQEGMLTDVIQGDQVSDTIRSFLPMWMIEKHDEAALPEPGEQTRRKSISVRLKKGFSTGFQYLAGNGK